MSADTFPRALTMVLSHEGGYVNHPLDPGGPTNHGVTQATLSAYLGRKASIADVKNMPMSTVSAIYRKKYANVLGYDRLPAGLDYVVLDFGVNSGVTRSGKFLQQCLRPYYTGDIDGQLGDKTFEALRQVNNIEGLIEAFCDARLKFLKKLKGWKTFGKGWGRRVAEAKAEGLRMFRGHAQVVAEYPCPTCRDPEALKVAASGTVVGQATAATTGSIGGAASVEALQQGIASIPAPDPAQHAEGVAGALTSLHDTLAPLGDALSVVKYALIAVTVVSALIGLYVAFHRINHPDTALAS